MSPVTNKPPLPDEVQSKLHALLHDYRECCLWFIGANYTPNTRAEWLQLLDLIERYGDGAAFQRTAEVRRWL